MPASEASDVLEREITVVQLDAGSAGDQQQFTNSASIVLTGSINAHVGMANSSVYSATKEALRSLARAPSGELVARGVCA